MLRLVDSYADNNTKRIRVLWIGNNPKPGPFPGFGGSTLILRQSFLYDTHLFLWAVADGVPASLDDRRRFKVPREVMAAWRDGCPWQMTIDWLLEAHPHLLAWLPGVLAPYR
jgi:hypothetical protein